MSGQNAPILLWFRRDFRLQDHPALTAACAAGVPVIPVFICDELVDAMGAAPKWRLSLAIEQFGQRLGDLSSKLILRRGDALTQLQELTAETGARAVYWSRAYDPQSIARDTAVKAALKQQGVEARSFAGHLMFEPWGVETKAGGYFKVYSPFWRAVEPLSVAELLPAPRTIPAPAHWPASDHLDDWGLGAEMNRGADVMLPHQRVGEDAAQARLHQFADQHLDRYKDLRDFPALDATSGLSENLALGEISPHRCWWIAESAVQAGSKGAVHFRKELVWREFAYHLMYHTPWIAERNWKEGWDQFPWQTDPDHPHVRAWKQGRTGIAFVDAAMREMYVTGHMHNRARMIVASYLTKHLMTHWQIGMQWFEDCLTDWDPASNAMGWQWTAGSGPDAAPYFRVFNPVTQLDKFDADRAYRLKWLAEITSNPSETALSYFDAVPRHWALTPSDPYPEPVVSAEDGRKLALVAYENRVF